jgi:heme-degrading monooxygenase HmoA
MSVVKINAIEVPEGAGEELEARFAARAGAVEGQPGFQYFQLLRPTEGESRYFVVTWWDSEESFQAWMSSRDFAAGHGGGDGRDDQAQPGARPPVATGTSLMSFEVVEQTGPADR